ncbi:hypothetical protein VP1G_04140 [Cytospora mali]|uniref:GAR domain-containing protein n=1 Tax=Cytospora mali TaxID=578113 RepID=A0A194UYR8_CYTMA|nr:hypothetical protein VP1G_04140 [Valsa mali var. pyri (nom. inval.)]
MTESAIHPPPGGRLMLSTRIPYHTTTHSPTTHQRKPSDDFISRLSPMNAIETFRAPSGSLKACMDAATAAEQGFAIRAAVASRNIYEWLDEIQDWPWPKEGGIGFLTPAVTKGELPSRGRTGSTVEIPEDATAPPENLYYGSLKEADIVRYETRIGQIQKELDKLDIEEIKRHVLHNHIMPLSRPGTPASPSFDRHFGMSSLASYTKMDDLTAVITATVVQALPNLSRLLRVMNAWSTRLALLRRVPLLMSSLTDAETAVQSGLSTLEQGFKPLVDQLSNSQSSTGSKFSHNDFEITKLGLEKKISMASRILDYMLDTLEGRDDTLPDEWIDRMEAVEQGYADWVTAYEKMLCDAQSAALKAQAEQAENETSRARGGSKSGVVINVQHAEDDVPQPSVQSIDRKIQEEADRPIPNDGNRGSPHTPPKEKRSASMSLGDMPPVFEVSEDEESSQTPPSSTEKNTRTLGSPFVLSDASGEDDHLRQQISAILENIPAKVHLSQPSAINHLNPPDLQLPYSKPRSTADKPFRSRSSMSSRAGTPSFMLAPVPRTRQQRGPQDIKLYHLSRGTGEPPLKLSIRCVGERVMVRVGGGWADLGEYLKEYAYHHIRRSHQGGDSRVEVRDMPRSVSSLSTRTSVSPPGRPSPPSRPASAAESTSPIYVKKTRKPSGGEDLLGPRLPRTPIAYGAAGASEPPSSGSGSTGRSRSSSGISWTEEDSSLGMAGPRSMRKDIPQESLDWVESIKEKVRAASSNSEMMRTAPTTESERERRFGDIGKIGGTKRLFRKTT